MRWHWEAWLRPMLLWCGGIVLVGFELVRQLARIQNRRESRLAMTEDQALASLLDNIAVIFPDGLWRIYEGIDPTTGLYRWRHATPDESTVLLAVARTAGQPGPISA